MRIPLILALVLILILTLAIWGFSNFVQPILSPDANKILYLFFLALLGIIAVLTGIPDIIERLSSQAKKAIPQERKQRPEVNFKNSTVQGDVNVAGRDIVQKITNYLSGDTEQQRALRNRSAMLKIVWDAWIEGVLKKSLYSEVLLELGMETRPGAVEHPWDMILQMPEQEPRQIPPEAKMLELFDAMNGSMLILGEPGSGKTTMLLELCRQAIERAEMDTSQPIPLLFNLSSWTPKQTLAAWLVEELYKRHYIPKEITQGWLDNDDLMVLLDGLDEVAVENRSAVVSAVNQFIGEHLVRLAVCSRRVEYEQLAVQLKLRGAVLIQPLTDQQVDEYLKNAGNGLARIHQAIKQDADLRDFAQTPLILSILVLTYRDAPAEDIENIVAAGGFRSRLFDAYVAQMIKHRGASQPFPIVRFKEWLSWLARGMLDHQQTIFYIEDIQPSWMPMSYRNSKVLFGLLGGLGFGLIGVLLFGMLMGETRGGLIGVRLGGLLNDWKGGLLGGPIFGLLVGLLFFIRGDTKPTNRLSWTWHSGSDFIIFRLIGELIFRLIVGLIVGLLGGLIVGLIGGGIFGLIFGLILGLFSGLDYGLILGLVSGLLFGFLFGLFFGLIGGLLVGLLVGLRGNRIEQSRPEQGIHSSVRNCLLTGLLVGLIGGLSYSLLIWLIGWLFETPHYGLSDRLIGGLTVGLLCGLSVGLVYGGEFLVKNLLSRFLLYRSGHIPWNLVAFLDYATDRIFLRRVGGGYIFIHRMLVEHFAAMYPGEH